MDIFPIKVFTVFLDEIAIDLHSRKNKTNDISNLEPKTKPKNKPSKVVPGLFELSIIITSLK